MAVSTIYWPTRGIRQDKGVVVGWRIEDVAVIVGIVDEWMTAEIAKVEGPELQVIATAGLESQVPDRTTSMTFEVQKGLVKRCSLPARVILFDPPDPVRLRYLTTSDQRSTVSSTSTLGRQDEYGIGRKANCVGMERVVPFLNKTRSAQRSLKTIVMQKSMTRRILPGRPPILWVFALFSRPLSVLLSFVHRIATLKVLATPLVKYSSTLQQLALRSDQILSGPADFRSSLHDPAVPLHIRSGRYVKFWNTVWLILNDLLFGYCAKELLVIAGGALSRSFPAVFQRYAVEDVISALAWLDDWPVGLKLNTPLSRFFRSTFTAIISTWGDLIIPIMISQGAVSLSLLGWTGYGGFTLFLSVVRDSIDILTLHLRLCYLITKYLVVWQLDSLGGLWNLFRGKKWNVLRQRTDSYAYDVDQLFLGTLLFTVSAFLLPTVLTYAALFSAIRAGLWLVDKMLDTFTQALNAFPLFEVLLRIKEPSRLPNGVIFRIRQDRDVGKGSTIPRLELRNAPRSLASILFKHRHGSSS